MVGSLGDLLVLQSLEVIVVSCDGWSWALAWAQLRVARITCYPLTSLAKAQLPLLLGLLNDTVAIDTATQLPLDRDSATVISGHLDSSQQVEAVLTFLGKVSFDYVTFISGTDSVLEDIQSQSENRFQTAMMRHRRIGGLTTARVRIGWSPIGTGLYPGRRTYPLRPIGAFLEPSSRLREWRLVPRALPPVADHCWDSTLKLGATPFVWPPTTANPWVRTKSVFFKERLVERPITGKEKAQLLDLREDWGDCLVNEVWEWNQMTPPPLRLLVEFILSAKDYLQLQLGLTDPARKGSYTEECFDWSRTRPLVVHQPAGSLGSLSPVEERIYFGWHWDSEDGVNVSTAAKADDAEVDLSLWNVGGDEDGMEEARKVIRDALHSRWVRRLTIEAAGYFASQVYESPTERDRDREALLECIERCQNSTWWDWSDGSRLHFWRWPQVWRREARDGARAFHLKELSPRLTFPQVPINDAWTQDKISEKLLKLVRRRYLTPGPVSRVIPYFPVPKPDDIRVVWDLRLNGVNEMVYTPSFQLPTPASYHRQVEAGTEAGDFDIGEQFSNYQLHPTERPYMGVKLPPALVELLQGEGFECDGYLRWDRLPFGWQSSPYQALRMLARALEMAMGAPDDEDNPFAWATVEMNLPGMTGYDPGKPRVRRLRADGLIAAFIVSYFDDGRVAAPLKTLAEQALRRATSELQYLGNQDAARKR